MRAYTVVAGDTLYGIADRFGVPRANIVAANPQITNIDLIRPGDIVYVPSTGTYPAPASSGLSLGGYGPLLLGVGILGVALVLLFNDSTPPARRKYGHGGARKKPTKMKTMTPAQYATVSERRKVGTASTKSYRRAA